MDNYFNELYSVNLNNVKEQKNKLDYISWAWAWAEVKKRFPMSYSTVYENAQGWNYHTDGNTCWVKVGVTVEGLEHVEYLPIMDYKNVSIPASKVTSMDVNKAIQRALTKAIARHGLGLYVYAGEDLPEEVPAEVTHATPTTVVVPAPDPTPSVTEIMGYDDTPVANPATELPDIVPEEEKLFVEGSLHEYMEKERIFGNLKALSTGATKEKIATYFKKKDFSEVSLEQLRSLLEKTMKKYNKEN